MSLYTEKERNVLRTSALYYKGKAEGGQSSSPDLTFFASMATMYASLLVADALCGLDLKK